MNTEEFERILDVVVEQLGQEVRASKAHHAPDAFQRRVLEVLKEVAKTEKLAEIRRSSQSASELSDTVTIIAAEHRPSLQLCGNWGLPCLRKSITVPDCDDTDRTQTD